MYSQMKFPEREYSCTWYPQTYPVKFAISPGICHLGKVDDPHAVKQIGINNRHNGISYISEKHKFPV